MISPYEQMAEAAKTARSTWISRNNEATRAFNSFLNKFAHYCQMPHDLLKIMPWDEKEQVYKMKEGIYGVAGNMHRDEENDKWGLGIYIQFNPLNHFPPLSVQFAVFLKQEGSKFIFRTADSEPHTIDLSKQTDWDTLFATIVASTTAAFEMPFLPRPPTKQPQKAEVNQYGFVVDLASND